MGYCYRPIGGKLKKLTPLPRFKFNLAENPTFNAHVCIAPT